MRAFKSLVDPLPPHWERRKQQNGDVLYMNTLTNQVQFEKPKPLAPGWRLTKDKKTGVVYYWNVETRETVALNELPPPPPAPGLPSEKPPPPPPPPGELPASPPPPPPPSQPRETEASLLRPPAELDHKQSSLPGDLGFRQTSSAMGLGKQVSGVLDAAASNEDELESVSQRSRLESYATSNDDSLRGGSVSEIASMREAAASVASDCDVALSGPAFAHVLSRVSQQALERTNVLERASAMERAGDAEAPHRASVVAKRPEGARASTRL